MSYHLLAVMLLPPVAAVPPKGPSISVNLRSQYQPFKGAADWREVTFRQGLYPKRTALVICDMWDDHWCKSAAKRCDALAKKAAPVVEALRKKGVLIIHCPSDCMEFYKDTPQRKLAQMVPRLKLPPSREISDPPLPIDDKDGGCDDPMPAKPFRAWKRQHAAIRLAEGDLASDNGAEVYANLKVRNIDTLLVMGVHTNMCVLNRSFSIKQMTRWGIKCVLVRDLTDAMYNPKKRPFVSHDEGTKLVIGHIERYWCPSVESSELVK